MNMAMQMMEMHAAEMPATGMDMAMIQECIEACAACEQACTMCASSMMGDEMMKCTSMCMNSADMANTMMRMMMRPAGMHAPSMMTALQATMSMSNACADECKMRAETSDDARMCADVNRQLAACCQKLMDALTGMMPTS